MHVNHPKSCLSQQFRKKWHDSLCAGFHAPATVRSVLESPGSSELNEEEESPEPDVDYMDDYDSDEERKNKKKKRPPPKMKNNSSISSTTSTTRSTRASDNDKPFLCNRKTS